MIIYFIDLDGTIEDSKLDMTSCVEITRKKFNLPQLNPQFIELYVNKGMDELYKNCFADYLESNPEQFAKIKDEYESCYLNNVCIQTKCYENIAESLEFLSKKGSVVVITNKPEKISRELLKKLNLYPFITDVMGGDSCSECKPSPLPLILISKKLGFNPEKDIAFMIGDSEGDIKTAQAFGAKSVWCSWGYLKELTHIKADIVLDNPSQLKEL